MSVNKIITAFSFPAFIFLINQFVFNPLGLYTRWPWFDIPMHFIGGIAVAITGHLLLKEFEKDKTFSASPLIRSLVIICFVAFIAVAWEWYEYLFSIVFHSVTQPDNADTMKDLFFGILGACFACVMMKRKN